MPRYELTIEHSRPVRTTIETETIEVDAPNKEQALDAVNDVEAHPLADLTQVVKIREMLMPHIDMEVSDYILSVLREGIELQQDWVGVHIEAYLEVKANLQAKEGDDVSLVDDKLAALYAQDKELKIAWDALARTYAR